MGGRTEVWYGVVCRICPSPTFSNPTACSWCGEGVTFSPSQTNLKQTKVTLNNLLTRVTYLIQVLASLVIQDILLYLKKANIGQFSTRSMIPIKQCKHTLICLYLNILNFRWNQDDTKILIRIAYQCLFFIADPDFGTNIKGRKKTKNVSFVSECVPYSTLTSHYGY